MIDFEPCIEGFKQGCLEPCIEGFKQGCLFLALLFLDYLLYPQHTKYVGVYSFRFSVRPFVFSYIRSFLCTFVRSSFRHRVKVFALKFIRPHILKTL